ncbi:hypothetical protein [Bacillus mycoides]|uniref:hypothetical protein n=1 Tax=Bacillus mycoides TaxID=1405 RepID=UPI001C02ED0E|nr:hypothetical protein [Bacillus mycoides]QWG33368.1 hypothetical protein EXW30_10720 [Bacillus mycoides]
MYKIEESGFYVEPVDLAEGEAIPNDCVNIPLLEGLFKAKFDKVKQKWIEGLSKEEIDKITNQPIPPDPLETLGKQFADLEFKLTMNGVL